LTERSAETPRIESFVLRFVEDVPEAEPENARRAWHAVILHVQTKEEKSFANFADAVAFIARYVPVGEFAFPAPAATAEPDVDGRVDTGAGS
jgi:hypothetical protein